jgi:hypothetical protein
MPYLYGFVFERPLVACRPAFVLGRRSLHDGTRLASGIMYGGLAFSLLPPPPPNKCDERVRDRSINDDDSLSLLPPSGVGPERVCPHRAQFSSQDQCDRPSPSRSSGPSTPILHKSSCSLSPILSTGPTAGYDVTVRPSAHCHWTVSHLHDSAPLVCTHAPPGGHLRRFLRHHAPDVHTADTKVSTQNDADHFIRSYGRAQQASGAFSWACCCRRNPSPRWQDQNHFG